MPINPLNIKWGKSLQAPQPELGEPGPPVYLGRSNEEVREARDDPDAVTIQVSSMQGVTGGEYKVTYSEGTSLNSYLRKLGMRAVLKRARAYDMGNLDHGKCRSNYVPGPGAKIRISPPGFGAMSHLQRTSHNAENLASGMGGGKEVVEVNMQYGNHPVEEPGVEQF